AQTPAPAPKTPPSPSSVQQLPAPAPQFDQVVLTVGDETMTVGQFQQLIDSLPEQYRAAARGAGKRQLVDQLVSVKTLAHEARNGNAHTAPPFKTRLAFQAENLLAGSLSRDFSSNLKIEAADLRKYYDAHKSEYESAKARHILVRMKGSPVPVGTRKE